MSLSITNIENLLDVNEKTRNLYDNYDHLISVIKYDSNKNVDYVLKAKNNASGKSAETQKFEQVIVDIVPGIGPTDITVDSATIRARVYKNNNSKVYETGVIYWQGNTNESILNKPKLSNTFSIPSVFKGYFTQRLTDLQDNATYNYRAFVRHEYGTNYSKVHQFKTTDTATIFAIAGDRFNGPAPLTVNLTAVNAGFGSYTYAWNMTGGNIGFKYPLNSINVTFSGEGYTPFATNYTLNSITVSVTGSGYEVANTKTSVLVNGVVVPQLTANLAFNNQTLNYGITSVSLPVTTLSGFQNSALTVTFAPSSDGTSMFFVGLGDGNSAPYTDEAAIATKIQTLNPSPEFVVHTGDINQDNTESSFVNNWLPLWNGTQLLSSMYLAFGNHDLEDGTYGDYLLNYLPATRDEIGSTNRTNKKYCYDFVKGLCHFFVINTGNNNIQSQGTAGDPFADINGQLDEIIPKITASKARWKIFVCHRPPYTNDEIHRPGFFAYPGTFWQNIKSRLNFAALGIDVVLNGHGQQYSVYQKDGVYFIQNGVGGANRRNSVQPYLPETVTVIDQKVGYIKYYVDYNKFKWEFVDVEASGNDILDSRTITKTSTTTFPASGFGSGSSYQIPRENVILVDGTYQPSLSVVTYQKPETGVWTVSSVLFLSGSIDYNNGNTRNVVLSTNGPVTIPATVAPDSSIFITNADYTTRSITHTFSAGRTYSTKVYALFGDQIQKQAIKLIRVTGSSDYSPEWQPVLTSPFANNIIAAYDFRNLAGSTELNKYPHTLYSVEEPYITIAGYDYVFGGYIPNVQSGSVQVKSPYLPIQDSIGGYINISGYLPQGIGGYDIGGYNHLALFGPGIVGQRALRFTPISSVQVVGGYDSSIGGYVFRDVTTVNGQRWTSGITTMWNVGQPFTLSLWINYNEFKSPGTKIFSILPWGYWDNNNEFSITQSNSALKIFKNTYLDEVIGGYLATEPIAGYFTGYPMLCTSDPDKMLTPNVWNHMVVTRDTENLYKYYKNGVLMLSSRDTGWGVGGYDNFGGNFGFGGNSLRSGGVGGYAFEVSIGNTGYVSTQTAPPSGLIDSVATWRKALSENEVAELYNSGEGTEEFGYLKPIVGPKLWLGGIGQYRNSIDTTIDTDGDIYWDNVSLYTKFDGTEGSTDIIDSSTNAVNLSATGGAAITTSVKKYGTGSAKFGNIGGYVYGLSGEDYGAFGLDDFTIEWWEYIAGYGSAGTVGGYYSPVIFYGNPGFGAYDNSNKMIPQWGITRAVGGYGRGTGVRFYLGGLTDGPDRWNKFMSFNDNYLTPGGGFALSAWSHNVIQRKAIPGSNPPLADYSYYKNGALAGYLGGYQCVNIGSIPVNYYYGIAGYNNLVGYGPGTSIIGAGIIGGYHTWQDSPEWYYTDGYIDDLRITKGIARYSSNFVIPTTAYPTNIGSPIGTRFRPVDNRGGSFAVAQETVQLTYPHTVAFIGKANTTSTDRTIFQNIQTTYRNNVGIQLFGGQTERTIHHGAIPFDGGVRGSNMDGGAPFVRIPAGTHPVGGYPIFNSYIPSGNEWFYIAYSYLGPNNNNQIRYYLQTPSVSAEGVVAGYSAPGFAGYPGFGIGGYGLTGYFSNSNSVERGINAIDGVVRLGMYINQGFNSHEDMLTLYRAVTAGPANDLKLQ